MAQKVTFLAHFYNFTTSNPLSSVITSIALCVIIVTTSNPLSSVITSIAFCHYLQGAKSFLKTGHQTEGLKLVD
jgi:hypothetical protein